MTSAGADTIHGHRLANIFSSNEGDPRSLEALTRLGLSEAAPAIQGEAAPFDVSCRTIRCIY